LIDVQAAFGHGPSVLAFACHRIGMVGDAADQRRSGDATLVEEVREQWSHPTLVVAGDAGPSRLLVADVHDRYVHGRQELGEFGLLLRSERVELDDAERISVAEEPDEQLRTGTAVERTVAVDDERETVLGERVSRGT